MRTQKPIIGIATRHDLEAEKFYLAQAYSEAVESAGGVPILIPLIGRQEYTGRLAGVLEGLLLPGSASDVDPLRYGQEPHPRLKEVHPRRDETDLSWLNVAEQKNLPLLAICFGMQALNVSRGGSLLQDIEACVPQAIKHEQGPPRDRASHTVNILPESLLAKLSGADSFPVNSHHHQAVGRLGTNLRATAWAGDGIIEAVEDVRVGRWVMGVQWHPELGWARDPLSRALFESFIGACRGPGGNNQGGFESDNDR